MTHCTFVHAADLHLDAPFRGVTRQLAADGEAGRRLRTLLEEATFTAFERLIETCLYVQADFLVLAGDIYNAEESSLRAYFLLHEGFSKLREQGIRVFLAHGNHDPLPVKGQGQAWPDNVTVFGPEVSSHIVYREDVPVAFVHGISHVDSHEPRNLATLFQQRAFGSEEQGLVHVGVLHCALQGETGRHARYAPCTGADLLQAGFDYFALGHVHSCLVFHPQEGGATYGHSPLAGWQRSDQAGGVYSRMPLYAYSGSAQGLHVNEAGPHGCLVVTAEAEGMRRVRFTPLAPVEWETAALSLEELEAEDESDMLTVLEDFVANQLVRRGGRESLARDGMDSSVEISDNDERGLSRNGIENFPLPTWQPEARFVRVDLIGRTPLHGLLRKPENVADLETQLSRSLAGTGVWLRDITVSTRPASALENAELRQDFIGELARHSHMLSGDEALLAKTGQTAFTPLYKSVRMRKRLPEPDGEAMQALLEEARLMCFDLLEADE